jgi:hypothetical protein
LPNINNLATSLKFDKFELNNLKMKKLLLLASVCLSLNAVSQGNPDQNFDGTWITNTNYPAQEPLGWISTNVLTNSFASASNSVSVTKSSTVDCAGGFSMRVETHKYTLGALTGFLPDTCGFAFTGTVSITLAGGRLIDGFAYNQRPAQITYCYKAEPMPNDTCGVSVLLWKYNGTSRVYIGAGKNTYTSTTAAMTNATLNISYSSTDTPDSMCVYVGSSFKFPTSGTSIRKGAQRGSVMYVDNFSWTASTVGVKENAEQAIQLVAYPNPAHSNLFISTESKEAKTIEIIDLTGRVIEKANFTDGKLKLDLTNYNTGLYLYTVYGNGHQNLKSGKFTVTH